MSNLIFYEDKKVPAQGLNHQNKIDENKLKSYFSFDDYENLNLLDNLPKFNHQNPTLLYPGCGVDIFFPLIYLEKLFPKVKQAYFIFNDLDLTLGMIKTCLDDVGISFSEENNRINFYWKNILINLEFIYGNIIEILSKINSFDIYFERAFRIMKDALPHYENIIFSKLNQSGLLISDSGFQEQKLKKINVSQDLSLYEEMIIGIK
ncbi:MAG: hypothetical protein KKH52_03500 [Nanoarchaeota archaeon]|nr:hypothetical protein [Nanoarchaeota archaeon]MBU1622987.1 hypothetical protein [Nanoarchaeota archaeon]MBU1974432.1 hypothetical protein [Nanoarchaeota archaeon]